MQGIDQLHAWNNVAGELKDLMENPSKSPIHGAYEEIARKAEIANPWFTRMQIDTAFAGILKMLDAGNLKNWMDRYTPRTGEPKKVGVIMAGNIPLAGFHDFLCVLLSGNHLVAKLSGSDNLLLPFLADLFCAHLPEMKHRFEFAGQLKGIDAVIATGSNNTGRYFDYYFGKQPHLFRKNRNSVAVLTGAENEFDLILLGRDIFTYFGMGCRNVSKLYVPEGYNFNEFFHNMIGYSYVLDHNKYMNNVDYHQALYLLNQQQFLTNNFLIVIEDKALSSPVGVLHYETYSNETDLEQKLEAAKGEMQCLVRKNGKIQFGQAQSPGIDDYADGVDTMAFLTGL